MTELLNFFGEHTFLAWCALWLIWPLFHLAQLVLFKLPNRILRTIRVAIRGWPPAHVDADGDFRPDPEVEAK